LAALAFALAQHFGTVYEPGFHWITAFPEIEKVGSLCGAPGSVTAAELLAFATLVAAFPALLRALSHDALLCVSQRFWLMELRHGSSTVVRLHRTTCKN
jgi:hypothetical protein